MCPTRVLAIFGTRPEAIKLAPVISEMRSFPSEFEVTIATTGQHRQLLDQVLTAFDIHPDIDMAVMTPSQTPLDVLGRVTAGLQSHLVEIKPDLILVQGDTTTTLAGAIAGAHHHIPVAHVEAGLRSGSLSAPFPEEINRRLTTHIASYHFASTERARQNLIAEGVSEDRIEMTGNTVVDALMKTEVRLRENPIDLSAFTPGLDWDKTKVILVTGHRRESFGKGFGDICDALEEIAQRHQDVHIVYPVHLNPQVHDVVHARLGRLPNVDLLPPADYLPFIQMMMQCHLILTDSGGVQEEAPTLGKPILVMRERTERPETIEVGAGKLVGTDAATIVRETERLLTDPEAHRKMAVVNNPHGEGDAAAKIVRHLRSKIPFSVE